MKLTNYFLGGFMAVAIVATGCTRGSEPNVTNEEGTITVSISKKSLNTRGLINSLTDVDLLAKEDNVSEYMIYFFNQTSGALELATAGNINFNAGGIAKTAVVGLPMTTGNKRIVVIANGVAAGLTALANSDTYDDLLAFQVDALSQSADGGLLMTGETQNVDPNLYDNNSNPIPVAIGRLVAKVQLGTVTIGDDVNTANLLGFSVAGVSVQRVVSTATIAPGAVTAVETAPGSDTYVYYGGLTGGSIGTNTPQGSGSISLLTDVTTGLNGFIEDVLDPDTNPVLALLVNAAALLPVNVGLTPAELLEVVFNTTGGTVSLLLGSGETLAGSYNSYYYVLPNNPYMYGVADTVLPGDAGFDFPTGSYCTLLTLHCTSSAGDFYMPIMVNDEVNGTAGDTTDGSYIKSNYIYTINLTINDIIGSPDPDLPLDGANLGVQVTIQPWSEITQNETWL